MSAVERAPFSPRDLLAFAFVSDPQLSPDGRQVAYVHTTFDKKENSYRSQIWVAAAGPASGGYPAEAPRLFTRGPKKDTHPRWSPDGRKLAFLSDREGESSQIWVMPTTGGEARQLTRVKGGIAEFTWAPDSQALLALVRVGPKGLEPEEEEEPQDDSDDALFARHTRGVKHITRLRYKLDGLGYFGDKRPHLFIFPVDGSEPIRVTGGEFDYANPCWAPDGRAVAYTACRHPNADDQRFTDLWIQPLGPDRRPEGHPVKVTGSTGPVDAPAWSPDGARIAYLGNHREDLGTTNLRVFVADVGEVLAAARRAGGAAEDGSVAGAGGRPVVPVLHDLTAGFDQSFGDASLTDMRYGSSPTGPQWAPDGSAVYLICSEGGANQLMRVDARTGEVSRVTAGDRVIYGAHLDPRARRAALAIADAEAPGDIWVAELDGRPGGGEWGVRMQRLTAVNAELLASRLVSLPERFTFRAEGGPEVDGWLLPPVNREPGKRYPAVLEVHGGPAGMYTGSFFFEFQCLASAGIGVIFTNPRGSRGYGQAFCGCIRGQWGDKDFQDCMAGVEAAVERADWIDPQRVGIAGGSYGGFMVNWALGHTDRFKAGVTMRSVVNRLSSFGTSDFGYRWDENLGCLPWENPMRYLEQSPWLYVANIHTPLLIIHPEGDLRCPIDQGEQLYAALKKLGRTVEFVRYPDEFHGLSRSGKPWHRVHRLEQIIGWFKKYLAADGPAGAADGPAPPPVGTPAGAEPAGATG